MKITLNADSGEIKRHELTKEGFLKFWFVAGVPGKELIYDGGKRKEIINEDALFDEKSINSAVGKLVTLNHPPRAINAGNYKEYGKGTILQEYSKDPDTGALIVAAIAHDAELVKGIMEGKYKYTSMGYTAKKTANEDGVLIQSEREYDHGGVLDENNIPRAGKESKVIIDSETVEKSTEQGLTIELEQPVPELTSKTKPTPPASTTTTSKENKDMQTDIAERVELLTNWKSVLEENNKSIDYSADSREIKRQILSLFYPEKAIKSLKDDLTLDGFWLNFEYNYDAQNDEDGDTDDNFEPVNYRRRTPLNKKKSNNDSDASESNRDKFIKMLAGN